MYHNNGCPYQSVYNPTTSSSGYLVEDVLHLATDTTPANKKFSKITFDCGRKQTGGLLIGNAPNGMLGLGPGKISIPSILASQKLTPADSFSMCFSSSGTSRIIFGDNNSSSKHSQTPYTAGDSDSSYNVGITQVSIGKETRNADVTASFRTRSFLTLLMDPLYSFVTETIDFQMTQPRFNTTADSSLEYCYTMSSCDTGISVPSVDITFKGGNQFRVFGPGEILQAEGFCFYCLSIMKSNTSNAIGGNFLNGYRIIFDRENKLVKWEESDCKDKFDSTTTTSTPPTSDTKSPPTKEVKSTSSVSPKASPSTTISLLNSRTLALLIFLFL